VNRNAGARAVDRYLARLGAADRRALASLRAAIREVAPDAEERISYGIPTFRDHGNLVHYAAFRTHLSFFAGGGRVRQAFARELRRWAGTKSSVHFSSDHPIPGTLIRRIVRWRLRENRSRAAPRTRHRRPSPRRASRTTAAAASIAAPMDAVARAVERTIRDAAPALRRTIKYNAPTYQGRGDVLTIGVWSHFVAVGFWSGARLAARHPILQGSARSSRVVKVRSIVEARSPAFRAVIRAAAAMDRRFPVHPPR